MSKISLSLIKNAAKNSGIVNENCAAVVIKSLLELKTNSAIMFIIGQKYGFIYNMTSFKRKFILLLQNFIIYNYHDKFKNFCAKNDISIFNHDLEFEKNSAVYARFIFIIFLREEVNLKPPIIIAEDR